MKRIVTLSAFTLVIAFVMAGCQSNTDNIMQDQIDELRNQLEINQNELEIANARIKELQDELEKIVEQLRIDSGEANMDEQSSQPESDSEGIIVIDIRSNGQKNISQSSSFSADANQVLTLEIQSSITGGFVDFFLFSPSNQEQRITIGEGDENKTINLSEVIWGYNCTGLFDSGNIVIIGTVQ